MSVRPDNWGELCEIASIELGETEREAPVQRQLGTGIVMARRPDQLTGFGGGSCCGTDGCGD
ncbi:MAG: regulator [Planctomycetota bacterium]